MAMNLNFKTCIDQSSINQQSTSGVYMIPCFYGKQHVGETITTIKTRLKQQKAVFENKKNYSALAEHADTCQGSIQWDNTSILASEHQSLKRRVRESLEIQCQGIAPGQELNKEIGRYVKTNTWLPFLDVIYFESNRMYFLLSYQLNNDGSSTSCWKFLKIDQIKCSLSLLMSL